ncbi:Hydrogen peroxide-inducible genes activator [Aliiroseovarius sp. xm-v-225]|uniref:LysR family transcriptional regulator n=2 Tax=Aliiroseovarius TaxID=1658781 RepID=UPI00156940C4|nr:LysR family transcriptional regulator [Aliiroseovarius sp. xm-m-378]NRP45713.1 Hydrogen peroxide-inducible genes activator [Aliiroseovarius sp. xm-m-378]NRP66581.1 Hydrogen peroxide-inducible genes activator [Aliiroseovarius sp. xm-v-225]NRP93607.1 Hydrogen peroxide-inducible genes activator [Aliiroseovarius sp. xm-a-134]
MYSFMLYITLRQYEYIVTVAETCSLTDAAARLHVSQPSLSVAITRVEERIGRKIFDRRKGAGIMMTPFGHRFVEKAHALLGMASDIELGRDTTRPFVLGCFEDIAPWYLAPVMEKLKSRFPAITFQGLEGRFSGLASDVAEGRVDVAITYDIGFEGRFRRKKLREVAPVAFLSCDHPLAKQRSVDLAQLVDHPIILFAEDLSEGYLRNLFNELRLLPQVAHRATSLEMMRSLAAHGSGVGISYSRPPGNISYDGKPLVTIPVSTPNATAGIILLWSALREEDSQFREILETVAQHL